MMIITNLTPRENDQRKLLQRAFVFLSFWRLVLLTRMGCGSSTASSSTRSNNDYDFQTMIQTVQNTWLSVKKIDNLGPKTFAHVLHAYPVLKRTSKVSRTLKTEADLLRAAEVRELGNMLLAIYSDIIKNADVNLDERIRSKAIVLNRQRVKPRLVQHFGNSLYHIATHQINIRMTPEEKQSWETFISYVSSQLTTEMANEINTDLSN